MPSPSRPAKPTGRPSSYKPEFAEQAFRLCLLGATDAELADAFSVDERTVNRWKAAHPLFRQSLKRGKHEADAKVAQSLYRRALGYSHKAVKIMSYEGQPIIVPYTERYPPDTTAAIFWLKNRRPAEWRDRPPETPEDGEATAAKVKADLDAMDAATAS